MTGKAIMIQGTGSDVGKSIITAGLCRIFARKGYNVAPFKSQNMALNSYITQAGGEIGRAQAVQAEAAMVEATVEMNPILLKPNQDDYSQIIVSGKAYRNMTAREYYGDQQFALQIIRDSINTLLDKYQITVIEGAGSPAEINLRDYDLVNMKVAKLANAPVILVADIDRGGVFASIVGTLELLTTEEQNRIKGIIINKFRGDSARFEGGVEFIEKYTGKKVVGVLPYFNFKIPEEDSLATKYLGSDDCHLDIAVIYPPHISNFTDFDSLALEPETGVRYIKNADEMGEPDLIILPGSKNTIEDLQYFYRKGFVDIIRKKSREGIPVIGICGGFQMLGQTIKDPLELETEKGKINGIGLLDMETVMASGKVTRQIEAEVITDLNCFKGMYGKVISGYEIHQGRTKIKESLKPLFKIKCDESMDRSYYDGAINQTGNVWGTYLHGLFDNDILRRYFINYLREKKGLAPLCDKILSARQEREKSYNLLANHLQQNLDIDYILDLVQ